MLIRRQLRVFYRISLDSAWLRQACRGRGLWDNRRNLRRIPGNMATINMLNEGELQQHRELGIPADYGRGKCLPYYREATELVDVGPNLVGRLQRLTPDAAASWQQMVQAAAGDGVQLMIVSGFRSFGYQAELIRKKLAAGQKIGEILTVNAAPGFSQHHTGTAVDVATPGSRPLTEEFEHSDAFKWLSDRAKDHAFSLTYPRGNRFGFIYEPWHWAIGNEQD